MPYNSIDQADYWKFASAREVLYFTISSQQFLQKVYAFGQVGEWLKPTDCKSVTPCELRRFESFPVHQ